VKKKKPPLRPSEKLPAIASTRSSICSAFSPASDAKYVLKEQSYTVCRSACHAVGAKSWK